MKKHKPQPPASLTRGSEEASAGQPQLRGNAAAQERLGRASRGGPFQPETNALLSAAFGRSLSGLRAETAPTDQADALAADAWSVAQTLFLPSAFTDDPADAASMGLAAHEVAHALGASTGEDAVDQPGDPGERTAEQAEGSFQRFLSTGGPLPRLPVARGRARVHRKSSLPINKLDTFQGMFVDQHLSEVLTSETQQGMVFDDSEKDANKASIDNVYRNSSFLSGDLGGRLNIPKLRLSSVSRAGMQASDVQADGAFVNYIPGGEVSAHLDHASARDVRGGDYSVDAVRLKTLDATVHLDPGRGEAKAPDPETTVPDLGIMAGWASVESIELDGLKKKGSLDVGHISAGLDLRTHNTALGKPLNGQVVSGSLSNLSVKDADAKTAAGGLHLDTLRSDKVSLRDGNVESSGVNGTGLSMTSSGGGGGLTSGLIRQLAALVDDAKMAVTVPMNKGTYGSGVKKMKVKEGTMAVVSVDVVDGQLMPTSKVELSDALDTFLFTSVKGAYFSKGRLYLDVGLFPDLNISGAYNDALNSQDTSPTTDISKMVDGVLTSEESTPSVADTSKASVRDGSVSLRDGYLGSGGVYADLAPGNKMTINANGSEDISIDFARLVLDALQFPAGDLTVNTKKISTTGAGIDHKQGTTTMSADTFKTGEIKTSR